MKTLGFRYRLSVNTRVPPNWLAVLSGAAILVFGAALPAAQAATSAAWRDQRCLPPAG